MLLSSFRSVAVIPVASLLAMSALVGCSKSDAGGTTPTTPSTPANIAGTWSGSASDSSGTGTMSWTVTQNGSTISGSLAIVATDVNVAGVGTLSGSVSGNSVSFTLTIPAGGFGGAFASCTSTSSGTATVSGNAISGSYTGNVSGATNCSGAITAGQLNLNKQ